MKKLNKIIVPKNEEVKAKGPVNHILVIDCSGSMCYDLPKIRQQLHNKLPVMVNENDTVSLVWFSGKGQFGKLADKVKVHDLNDLEHLNQAIDKWLKPMGCTGFVDPLQVVREISSAKELVQDDGVYSMMFLTDGCDNQWTHDEIIQSVKELADLVVSAVFVEYGYYCNHRLLEEMAENVGGSLVFAEDFDQYDPVFDNVISRNNLGGRKVEVPVDNPMYGLVYSLSDEGAVTYQVEDEHVRVPEYVDSIYYFTNEEQKGETDLKALYQGLAILVTRRQSGFIRECLAEVGDVRIFNQFSNCIGKQKMYDFQKTLVEASNDETKRFVEGRQDNLKVNPDAFTVVDLLDLLSSCDCRVELTKMKYNRIGRMAEHSSELNDRERKELQEALENAKTLDEVQAIQDKIKLVTASKKKLEFKWNETAHPIKDVKWNETRPNISMLFKIDGMLELPNDAPEVLPKPFPTFIFRNYTIVRDGLINIEELPVYIRNKKAFEYLKEKGVVQGNYDPDVLHIINLRAIPLINEKMVQPTSARHYLALEYNLMKYKAGQKVMEAYLNELVPKERSQGVKDKYGDEAAEYLKAIGVTDGGYSPQTVLAEAKDSYVASELVVKFKGISTIPSWNAYQKKVSVAAKLNAADHLLENYDKICKAKKEELSTSEFVKWLANNIELLEEKKKDAAFELATIRFAIIVGQSWFDEFISVENCKMTYEPEDANPVDAEIQMKDTIIAI